MNAIIRLCGIAVMLLSLSVSGVAADTNDAAADRQKAILVTGASTGIGRKITEVLAGSGYFVYAALHALFDDKPLRRYMVVPNEQEAGWTIGKAVEELVQLNEGQAYAYSREQLIAMLDAAMAGDDAAEDGE